MVSSITLNQLSLEIDQKKVNFSEFLPVEICLNIFSLLNGFELARCLLVCKQWKEIASDEKLWKIVNSIIFFGKKEWEKYFGDIGLVPSIPKNIYAILNRPCPFWVGKKVSETHILVLIPKAINGTLLNLVNLGEWVKSPKEGFPTHFASSWHEVWGNTTSTTIIRFYDRDGVEESYWILMTKDIVEGSFDWSHSKQKDFIENLSNQMDMAYQLPHNLDAAICSFIYYVQRGKFLFPLELNKATRCKETIADMPMVVGGYSTNGLMVQYGNFKAGIAAELKLT